MSFILTQFLYNRFEEMPTRVTIESQFESLIDLPYPAITLCSPNQMTITAMKYFNRSLVDGNLTIDLQATLPMLLAFYEIMNNLDADRLQHLQDLFEENRYSVPEVLATLPQSCDDFLKRCYLEGKLYPKCAGLFKPILTTHGFCCAFNNVYYFNGKRNTASNKFPNFTINAVGLFNSLTVVSDYDPADAIEGTLLNGGAIRVMYTDWTEFPADDETSIVDPNGESYHILHITYTYCSDEVQTLPVWSRNCFFEDEHHLPYFRKYHNSDCDHTCYLLAVRQACGCYLSFVPNVRSEAGCKITHIPCIINVKKEMYNWLSAQECDCPRDCVSRRYRAEVVMGNFNAVPYMLRNPYAGLKLNKSTSVMHFFFSTPVYTKLKQETVMSIISLVSNLGGVFGLFMGCSCMSVLEVLFYIYLAIKGRLRRQRERRRLHNQHL
ncbi:unnamed protein product [Chrysodeixis includens]|uniref:Sodium channel protein Nach n=1 Tax=Chrysodeixis includens TaxID=689277 RepID=A0A9P0BRT6_CHRIL|nr:unnamed protein product [Chrysodeixis includens]